MSDNFKPELNQNLNSLFNSVESILDKSQQLLPMAERAVDVVDSLTRYQEAKTQLEIVKVKREVILRHYESLDKFISLAYQERERILNDANTLIKQGVDKKEPELITAGVEIIKAIIMANPYDKIVRDKTTLRDELRKFESNIE